VRHAYFVIRVVSLLLAALSAYSQQFTLGSTTTMREASPTDNVFYLASVAGIAAGSGLYVQDSETAPGELLQVRSINGLAVTVNRSQVGTKQTAHKSGATVLTGQFVWFQSTPAQGYCNAAVLFSPWVNVISGIRYECSSNAWTAVNGGGGGTGTFNDINGNNGPALSILGGTNVTIDNTVPDAITINATGGGGGGQPIPAGNGIVVNNGGASLNRTIAPVAGQTAVTNGDGVAGNPTIGAAAALDYGGLTSTKPTKYGTTPPATCTVPELFVDTDAASSSMFLLCTAANVWTPLGCALPTWVGQPDNYVLGVISNTLTWIAQSGSGGGLSVYWSAAKSQNTVGGSNGSWGEVGATAPVAKSACPGGACDITTTNVSYGVLAFDDTGTRIVGDHFDLPSVVPTFDADVKIQTDGTNTGTVTGRLYTACAGAGDSLDITWNSAQSVNFTPTGTARRVLVGTITGVTTTGCAGDETLMWKFDRNTADAGTDTMELISIYFHQ
jgi:hypothetical protein